tara:strand:- start:1336 stop:1458 length:123 start_codon:yes stop_codon:yes gene_type:complete
VFYAVLSGQNISFADKKVKINFDKNVLIDSPITGDGLGRR